MIRQIDPHQERLVLSRLRAANPVPRGLGRETPDQIESFLLHVMERTEMVQNISQRERDPKNTVPQWRRQPPRWLGFAAGFALAALIAIPVLLNDATPDRVLSDPALDGLPASQAELVSQIVVAVNGENFEDFRSHFAADGAVAFETGLHRPYHEGVEGGQPIPMTDPDGFEADFLWGASLDRRVELRDCQSQDARVFSCEIGFALEALRLGGVETLSLALDESGEIALLSTEPAADAATGDGEQPLARADLSEFEDWLERNHPDEYRRLVRPGTPGSINGVEIQLSFAPMNPELVPEMTALIDEYLASR